MKKYYLKQLVSVDVVDKYLSEKYFYFEYESKRNWFGKIFFTKLMYAKDGEVIIHVPKNTVVKNYNVDVSKL